MVVVGEQTGAVQGVGVGDGAGQVVGHQPPVEVGRARERLELGRGAAGEATAPERCLPRWSRSSERRDDAGRRTSDHGSDTCLSYQSSRSPSRRMTTRRDFDVSSRRLGVISLSLAPTRRQSVPNSMAALSRASSSASREGRVGGDALAPPAGRAPRRTPCSTRTWPWSSGWAAYSSSLERESAMSRLRRVSWPIRSVGPERGVLHPLHRQLVGVVGERRPVGAQDRVVLAAPQPHRHLAGDHRPDPALERLAQHQRLRVEPATLVQQPAEPPTLGVVVGEGVLVVDRVQQPLVGEEQQRHPGRLVDAARLGLDDPVLDLVATCRARAGRRSR